MAKKQKRTHTPSSKKGRVSSQESPPARRRLPLVAWIFAGILVAVVVAVGLSGLRTSAPAVPHQGHHQSSGSQDGQPIPSALWTPLTNISRSIWAPVGTGQASAPQRVQPIATGAPTVLFIGAEYCPYCAALRWPLAIALSRFGQLTGAEFMTSAANDVHPNTPTYSFQHAHYTSADVTLKTVELYTNHPSALGGYTVLQHPTSAENAIWKQYDKPPYVPSALDAGSIPFLLIGGRYLWIGSPYTPSMLANRNWSEIVRTVTAGKSSLARTILQNANEMTAAICASDGGHPGSVCNVAAIRTAEQHLPVTAP